EEQAYHYVVPLPAMSANNEGTVMGYVVPAGSDGAQIRVQIESVEDDRVVSVKDRISRESGQVVGEHDVLFLGAGSGLTSLKAVGQNLDKELDKEERIREKQREGNEGLAEVLRGRRQFAFADDVAALPDRWYGYDAVDVVIMATGKVEYVHAL